MTATADATWARLEPAWQVAFAEAWTSWCSGSLGIGAVLVDPTTETVVATGRNRVNETDALPGTLGGNFMAHAEMNAFAALDRYKAEGLHLFTTLQPCLMCAATAVFLHVERVHFAVADEYFDGLGDLWDHHPYSRRWKPVELGPLEGPLAGFARVLPLVVETSVAPMGPVMQRAHDRIPGVADLAVALAADGTLDALRQRRAGVAQALAEVWARLPAS